MDSSQLALISLRGVLVQTAGQQGILLVGLSDCPADFRDELFRGKVSVAVAVALLYEPDYMIPMRLIDDFRQQYFGFDAIHFMLTQGETFPRADVVGIRLSDSSQVHAFVREMDLGKPLTCVVYTEGALNSVPVQIDRIVLENIGLLDPYQSVFNASLEVLTLPESEIHTRYGLG